MKTFYQSLFKLPIVLSVILITGIIFPAYKNPAKIFIKETSDSITYNVVLFGNSLTKNGNWLKVLNRIDVKVSGWGGFTTSHFVWILKEAVLLYKPKMCFIEGGINDIGVGIPLSRTYKNFESIVDTLIKHKIEPVLQSTLYVNFPDDSFYSPKVDSLNYFLKKLALQKNLIYLDLNQFLSENMILRKEFTTDGVHLTESAYKIWIDEIKKTLDLRGI